MRDRLLLILCALLLLPPIVSAGAKRPGPCQIKEGAIVSNSYSAIAKAFAIQQDRDKPAMEKLLSDKLVYLWSSTRAPNWYVFVEREMGDLLGTRVQGTLVDVWAMRSDVHCPGS